MTITVILKKKLLHIYIFIYILLLLKKICIKWFIFRYTFELY